MYSLKFTLSAQEDLLRIKYFIEDNFSEDVALIKLKKIMLEIKRLAEYPLLGRPLANQIDTPTDYLVLAIDKNYVFYRINENTVLIIRILDTRQDFMNALFGVYE